VVNDANKGSVEIAVLGAGRRFESTECCSSFLNAILSGYGYSVVRQEIGLGTIRIWGQKDEHDLR